MSYEIYYDRKFIKVEDKYIPMFLHGSNNCTTFSYSGREVSEKVWGVENYKMRGQFLFTEAELNELVKQYDSIVEDGTIHKTRYQTFGVEEFRRYFLNGMKTAQPLEYYTGYGNSFYIYDWTDYNSGGAKTYYVSTNEELVAKLEELKGRTLALKFLGRELRLPKKSRQRAVAKQVEEFFILEKERTYLTKLLRNGYKYTWGSKVSSAVKKFKTEKQAQQYLEKYSNRLKGFIVSRVNEIAYL